MRERVREAERRAAEPTAGIVDSQSVKGDAVVGAASRGFDGGKLVNGRKRHLVVDCLALVLAVLVTPASVTDRNAASGMLPGLRECFRRLQLIWADGAYTGDVLTEAAHRLGLRMDIPRRSDDSRRFTVLPRRWVVERTFAWLMRSRRLAGDYERRSDTSGQCRRGDPLGRTDGQHWVIHVQVGLTDTRGQRPAGRRPGQPGRDRVLRGSSAIVPCADRACGSGRISAPRRSGADTRPSGTGTAARCLPPLGGRQARRRHACGA
ncbi:transposase [Streptomyces sp. fd1-xmd]|uniref:transposase n=1 Tax=Streptomyces sp. fd1-xmd TaxID=1812480 RepID=UPI0021F16B59|nr:transposase [Streptomyces sp. fd1-xmd]